MKAALILNLLLTLALFVADSASAQVPSILNYQGRVTIGGTNITTNAALFKFALVNSNGATAYWKNDGSTTTNEPSTAVSVAVAQGLYSVLLGDTTLGNMAAIPSAVFTNADVNLRVWFGHGTNAFVRLAPDQRIASAGYALRAAAADTANVTNVTGNLFVSGTLSAARVVGGSGNTSDGSFSVVAGGAGNTADNVGSALVGGTNNRSSGEYSFLGGGKDNVAEATYATVAGGWLSYITNSATAATVSGGQENRIFGGYSAIGGGYQNQAYGESSVIGGGDLNIASGNYAIIPGGANNVATNNAFAAGLRAKATNNGSFVWSGVDSVDTVSTNTNSFTVRAPGGVRFITSAATNGLHITNTNGVNGVAVAPGGTAWVTLSDRDAKTAVKPVDARAVLAKVGELPVTEWEYKHDPNRRYFGPMAQDFHAAFRLGEDDKTINTLDADGVLFLSVKGLMEELKVRDKAIDELKSEIRALRQQVENTPPAAP